MDYIEDTNLSPNDEENLRTDIATSSLNISLDSDYFFDKPPNCEDSNSLIADLVLTHLKKTEDGTIGSDSNAIQSNSNTVQSNDDTSDTDLSLPGTPEIDEMEQAIRRTNEVRMAEDVAEMIEDLKKNTGNWKSKFFHSEKLLAETERRLSEFMQKCMTDEQKNKELNEINQRLKERNSIVESKLEEQDAVIKQLNNYIQNHKDNEDKVQALQKKVSELEKERKRSSKQNQNLQDLINKLKKDNFLLKRENRRTMALLLEYSEVLISNNLMPTKQVNNLKNCMDNFKSFKEDSEDSSFSQEEENVSPQKNISNSYENNIIPYGVSVTKEAISKEHLVCENSPKIADNFSVNSNLFQDNSYVAESVSSNDVEIMEDIVNVNVIMDNMVIKGEDLEPMSPLPESPLKLVSNYNIKCKNDVNAKALPVKSNIEPKEFSNVQPNQCNMIIKDKDFEPMPRLSEFPPEKKISHDTIIGISNVANTESSLKGSSTATKPDYDAQSNECNRNNFSNEYSNVQPSQSNIIIKDKDFQLMPYLHEFPSEQMILHDKIIGNSNGANIEASSKESSSASKPESAIQSSECNRNKYSHQFSNVQPSQSNIIIKDKDFEPMPHLPEFPPGKKILCDKIIGNSNGANTEASLKELSTEPKTDSATQSNECNRNKFSHQSSMGFEPNNEESSENMDTSTSDSPLNNRNPLQTFLPPNLHYISSTYLDDTFYVMHKGNSHFDYIMDPNTKLSTFVLTLPKQLPQNNTDIFSSIHTRMSRAVSLHNEALKPEATTDEKIMTSFENKTENRVKDPFSYFCIQLNNQNGQINLKGNVRNDPVFDEHDSPCLKSTKNEKRQTNLLSNLGNDSVSNGVSNHCLVMKENESQKHVIKNTENNSIINNYNNHCHIINKPPSDNTHNQNLDTNTEKESDCQLLESVSYAISSFNNKITKSLYYDNISQNELNIKNNESHSPIFDNRIIDHNKSCPLNETNRIDNTLCHDKYKDKLSSLENNSDILNNSKSSKNSIIESQESHVVNLTKKFSIFGDHLNELKGPFTETENGKLESSKNKTDSLLGACNLNYSTVQNERAISSFDSNRTSELIISSTPKHIPSEKSKAKNQRHLSTVSDINLESNSMCVKNKTSLFHYVSSLKNNTSSDDSVIECVENEMPLSVTFDSKESRFVKNETNNLLNDCSLNKKETLSELTLSTSQNDEISGEITLSDPPISDSNNKPEKKIYFANDSILDNQTVPKKTAIPTFLSDETSNKISIPIPEYESNAKNKSEDEMSLTVISNDNLLSSSPQAKNDVNSLINISSINNKTFSSNCNVKENMIHSETATIAKNKSVNEIHAPITCDNNMPSSATVVKSNLIQDTEFNSTAMQSFNTLDNLNEFGKKLQETIINQNPDKKVSENVSQNKNKLPVFTELLTENVFESGIDPPVLKKRKISSKSPAKMITQNESTITLNDQPDLFRIISENSISENVQSSVLLIDSTIKSKSYGVFEHNNINFSNIHEVEKNTVSNNEDPINSVKNNKNPNSPKSQNITQNKNAKHLFSNADKNYMSNISSKEKKEKKKKNKSKRNKKKLSGAKVIKQKKSKMSRLTQNSQNNMPLLSDFQKNLETKPSVKKNLFQKDSEYEKSNVSNFKISTVTNSNVKLTNEVSCDIPLFKHKKIENCKEVIPSSTEAIIMGNSDEKSIDEKEPYAKDNLSGKLSNDCHNAIEKNNGVNSDNNYSSGNLLNHKKQCNSLPSNISPLKSINTAINKDLSPKETDLRILFPERSIKSKNAAEESEINLLNEKEQYSSLSSNPKLETKNALENTEVGIKKDFASMNNDTDISSLEHSPKPTNTPDKNEINSANNNPSENLSNHEMTYNPLSPNISTPKNINDGNKKDLSLKNHDINNPSPKHPGKLTDTPVKNTIIEELTKPSNALVRASSTTAENENSHETTVIDNIDVSQNKVQNLHERRNSFQSNISEDENPLVIADDEEFHSNSEAESIVKNNKPNASNSVSDSFDTTNNEAAISVESPDEAEELKKPVKRKQKKRKRSKAPKTNKRKRSQSSCEEEFNSNNCTIDKALDEIQKMKYEEILTSQSKAKLLQHKLINAFINPSNALTPASLLCQIFSFLSSSKLNPLLSYLVKRNKEAFQPPAENCIVEALIKTASKKKIHLDGLIPTAISNLYYIIIFKKSFSKTGLGALCRIFTQLCKHTGDTEKPIRLACDLIIEKHPFAPVLIVSMIGTWTDIFSQNEDKDVYRLLCLSSIYLALQKKPSTITSRDWDACKAVFELANGVPMPMNVDEATDVIISTIKEIVVESPSEKDAWARDQILLFTVINGWTWAEKAVISFMINSLLHYSKNERNERAFSFFAQLCADFGKLAPPKCVTILQSMVQLFHEANDFDYVKKHVACSILKILLSEEGLKIPVPDFLAVYMQENYNQLGDTNIPLYLKLRCLADAASLTENDIIV